MRGKSTWALAASLLLLGACGPTEAEVGGIALQALPLSLFFGLAVQRVYSALWRRLGEELRLDVRPTVAFAGISLLLYIVTLPRTDASIDSIGIGLIFVGTSYVTYLAIALRISVAMTSRSAFSWAPVVAWALLAVPAILLAFVGSTVDEASDAITGVFILPGYFGIVAGAVLALLIIEVAVRLHVMRKREREREPVFPEARIEREGDE